MDPLKITVLYEMSFGREADSQTVVNVSFKLPDFPSQSLPDAAKRLALEEVMLITPPILETL